jgi:hypothetical protein
VPHRKYNALQDEFLATPKRMHEAKTVQEKMALLEELQRILKESKEVLDEIHKKQAG